MFDTMTITKVLGGFCGALLIYLLANMSAEALYHVGGEGHGEEHAQGYVIATADEAPKEEAPQVDFATLLASADVGKGEKVFSKCRACHKIDGNNATGPHLDGVVNRAIDAVDGFNYSGALLQVGETWTPENLFTFLKKPKAAAPGTSMGFAGLSKETDRVNLIAFLETLGG